MTKYCKIILACMLICIIKSGYSIKCYDCRSDVNSGCADPFNGKTLTSTDCDSQPELANLPGIKATMCRKIKQKIGGEWRYTRTCGYIGELGVDGIEKNCVLRTDTPIHTEVCTCKDKDECNSSSVFYPAILLIIISALTAVVNYKYY